jgi:hypothetical protein
MKGSFHYDIRARCRIEEAVALIADVPRLASRHPLAVRTDELPASPGALRTTAVTSRLRLGPLRWSITYRADLVTRTEDRVVTVAHQRPRTTLVNDSRFTMEPDGISHISVDISYDSPWPIFRYGFQQAQRAHHGLAEGLKELLESGA